MVLDTGATAHLMKTTINHLLAQAQASNMTVRGAFGADRQPADRHGIAKMYILNTLEPRRHGSSIEARVDTLPGLNDELFSMSEYYEDMDCDIHLVHDGFSGIRGTDPRTGQRIEIPARYDSARKAWLVDYVIAKDAATARKAGRAVEAALARDTRANRALVTKASIADDDLAAALALFDGNILCRNDKRSCYINMTTLHNLCEARDATVEPQGGAGDAGEDASVPTEGVQSIESTPALCPTCPTEPAENPQNSTDDDNGRNAELERLQQIEDEMEDHLFKETDCNLSGPKRSMGSAAKKMALMELHKRKGHAGHVPGCPVCLMCRKNVRKRHAVRDPPLEKRVGYRWAIDGLTWPVRSRSGDRYTLVLRDYASGYYIVLHVEHKSDSCSAVETAIAALRNDPRFKDPWRCRASRRRDTTTLRVRGATWRLGSGRCVRRSPSRSPREGCRMQT